VSGLKPLSPARLICVFKRLGYVVTKRGAGDHIIMRKGGSPRPLVIPDYRELPVFIIRNNIRSAGIDLNRFLELLKDC